MSDIAMLVAEEYERRLKAGGETGETRMLSCVSAMLSGLKHKTPFLQWAFQPKTQLAMAASNSFFSA